MGKSSPNIIPTNPFLSQICFLHELLGSKFFSQSLRGLAADVQSYLQPLPGARAVVWPLSASSRRVPTAPVESKNAVSIPP